MSSSASRPLAKLRVLPGSQVCRILEDNGFAEVSQRGSHVNFLPPSGDERRSVTVPLKKEVPRGTLAEIIRTSELPRELFE